MRLSVRQRDVLLAIKDEIERTGFAPVADDIASKVGIGRGSVVGCVTILLLKKCLTRESEGSSSYRTLRLTAAGLTALSLPAKPDTQRRLEAILEAWDAPTGPGWADALEKAINDGRDEPDQSAEGVQVSETIEKGNLLSIDSAI